MAAVEGRFCMPIKYAGVVSCAGECSYAPTCMERAVGGAAQGAVIGGIWGACICCVLHMPNSRRRSILYIYIYIYIHIHIYIHVLSARGESRVNVLQDSDTQRCSGCRVAGGTRYKRFHHCLFVTV